MLAPVTGLLTQGSTEVPLSPTITYLSSPSQNISTCVLQLGSLLTFETFNEDLKSLVQCYMPFTAL